MAGPPDQIREALVKTTTTSIIAGVILMTMGVLLLLDQLGLIGSGAYVPPLTFTAVGGIFVAVFVRRRGNWWAAIPASVFLGLAAVIATSQFAEGRAAGAILFLFMASGFGAVYLRERSHWWALIPCGVMLILAVVASLPEQLQGTPAAAVLFLGLTATFALLSLVPVPGNGGTERMKWPLIPAAVLGLLGGVLAFQSAALLIAGDFIVLAVVILAGIGLLVYGYRARNNEEYKARGR
jgi:hypothetical protein